MSNHLHDFMEDGWYFVYGEPDVMRSDVTKVVNKRLGECVCFDGGDVEAISALKDVEGLIRTPYQNCWIEFLWREMDQTIGNLVYEEHDGVTVITFSKKNGKWIFLSKVAMVNKGKELFILAGDDVSSEHCSNHHFLVRVFLSALNCTNINRIEHSPPEKLQKARVRRGKKPLFSYWTLEIDIRKSRAAGEDYGGTHSSPRLHLRRGHPRQYAPGKWCWVQPHAVGNKRIGMVHKDYSVSPANQ